MVIVFMLACGGDVKHLDGFSSEETCKAAIPKVRAGFIGQTPLIDCIQK